MSWLHPWVSPVAEEKELWHWGTDFGPGLGRSLSLLVLASALSPKPSLTPFHVPIANPQMQMI